MAAHMTRRNRPEDALHQTVAEFLGIKRNLALPSDAVWTTMPAGGGGKVRGAKLKARGLKPGWPDILIVYRGRLICIELKSPKGVRSPAQKLIHAQLSAAGALVYTATSLAAVEGFLRVIIPLKARAA